MTRISRRLHRLRITARSPREAVVVSFDADGMAVSLGRKGVDGHTEASFAAEIRLAVNAALRGRDEAVRRAIAERLGEDAASVALPAAPGEVTSRAMSPHGLVTVTRGSAVDIEICRGTLRRMSDARLLTEINAALREAMRDYDRRSARLPAREAPELESHEHSTRH